MYVVQPFLSMVDGLPTDKQGERDMKIALINEFSQASKKCHSIERIEKSG